MHSVRFDELLYKDDGTYTHGGTPFSRIARDYFSNGMIRSEARFVDGYQEGAAKEWYDNGQAKFEGTYLTAR